MVGIGAVQLYCSCTRVLATVLPWYGVLRLRLRENDEFLDLAYDFRLYNGTSRTLWGCTAVTTENCQHTTIHVIFTFGDTRFVIDLHMSTCPQASK